jgi:hypothetical protein
LVLHPLEKASLDDGSRPAVASSKMTSWGFTIREIPRSSFLLLPPLKCFPKTPERWTRSRDFLNSSNPEFFSG